MRVCWCVESYVDQDTPCDNQEERQDAGRYCLQSYTTPCHTILHCAVQYSTVQCSTVL